MTAALRQIYDSWAIPPLNRKLGDALFLQTAFSNGGVGEDGQQSLFATAPKAKNGKTKYLFNLPGEKVLYMAGFWKQSNDEDDGHFVILTTAANSSMQEIHDRMPVVLRPEEQKAWLSNSTDFEKLFDRKIYKYTLRLS